MSWNVPWETGAGVLLDGKHRAVVVEDAHERLMVDCPTRNYVGQDRPGRFMTGRHLRHDPQGAVAPLRAFRCLNRHCYHNHAQRMPSGTARTALAQCPNCGAQVKFQE